jgi:hypothetical protein
MEKKRKERVCLMCQRAFRSRDPSNRICARCKRVHHIRIAESSFNGNFAEMMYFIDDHDEPMVERKEKRQKEGPVSTREDVDQAPASNPLTSKPTTP